jgi:uncharacterized membrane protein YphA (DoxX/SURF4 family)
MLLLDDFIRQREKLISREQPVCTIKQTTMKLIVNVARIITGALFIFSGLVKAIDPLGLSYKMQEFFEAWVAAGFLPGLMNALYNYSTAFSLVMITLEVAVGVALLLGYRIKLTAWITLLLMLFFTFLTSYVLFSGKIKACGCFGDCIPLTPMQTFSKDIILLLLVLLILFGRKHILPLFSKKVNFAVLLLSVIAVIFLQWWVLKHLPVVDCLPYKKGNNIAKLREMPADAVQDIYQKNGEKKEFTGMADSTWEFVERKQVLVEKGKNNVPLINDFKLTSQSGTDSTDAIFGQTGKYYLLFIKDLDNYTVNSNEDLRLAERLLNAKIPFYIVSSQPDKAMERFKKAVIKDSAGITVFTCDVKTAARCNPTLYMMQGAVVQQKWAGADIGKVKEN